MRDTILSHIDMSSEAYNALETSGKLKKLRKGDILSSPSKSADTMLFVNSGLLRGYRIVDGKEFTHHFYREKWFATDYKSFLLGESTELYIESLTDSECYIFQKKDLHALYAQYHELESLGRLIAEQAFLIIHQRIVALQVDSLKDRYKHLIQTNPILFQSVPQKYIASYLGVTEQSFSRIKQTINS
ncbi:MAG: Crp/Fnr family transcriptional regulator [Oceanospirillaceae bacterium]|nr:Crp/Fnr family transcriptional regulator [Oceanospirillaceae bacterium]